LTRCVLTPPTTGCTCPPNPGRLPTMARSSLGVRARVACCFDYTPHIGFSCFFKKLENVSLGGDEGARAHPASASSCGGGEGFTTHLAHLGLGSPHTRETLPKTHRPSVTTQTGNFGQGTSAIGHQAHGKLRPRHIGHRPPSRWETSARTARPWHTSTWHTSTMAHLGAHDTTMAHLGLGTPPPWHTSDLAHIDRGTLARTPPPHTSRPRRGVHVHPGQVCRDPPPTNSRPRRGVHVHLGQVCRDPPPQLAAEAGCVRAPWPGVS